MSQGLGADLDRAQAAHDAKEPTDGNGCDHVWRKRRSIEVGGFTLTELKCRKCGKTICPEAE
jgi:hypothetical protein